MAVTDAPTLSKKERIRGTKTMNRLFGGGHSKSMSAFPLRVVYAIQERKDKDAEAAMMVSVPKRMFKRAVKRNRVKRQVREGYRLNKQVLTSAITQHLSPDAQLLMAFIWIDDKLHPSVEVHRKVRSLMEHISERVIRKENQNKKQP